MAPLTWWYIFGNNISTQVYSKYTWQDDFLENLESVLYKSTTWLRQFKYMKREYKKPRQNHLLI